MSAITWIPAGDCDPPHGLDLTTNHDADKVADLVKQFEEDGFDRAKPALVGYVKDGRVQLLSGTHRHMAAEVVGIELPVVLWLGSDIDEAWGDLMSWRKVIEDIPVAILESWTRADIEMAREQL